MTVMNVPAAHVAILRRLAKTMGERDWSAVNTLFTEDYVEEYPQSGEVFRGRKNARAIRENYPGGLPQNGLDLSDTRSAPSGPRWVRTPAFTFVRAEGSGNVGTAAFRVRYRDQSVWWVILFYELRGDLIAHATTYFAPLFEPPEWRKAYIEQNERSEMTGGDSGR